MNAQTAPAVAGQLEATVGRQREIELPGGMRLTVVERCALQDWKDACVDAAIKRTEAAWREHAPRWRDVAEELPQEAQEVLFVRGSKTLHGAWIGGIFWHSNQKMAAAYWMPLPLPPNAEITGG